MKGNTKQKKVFAVVNQKGGVGKTTTAITLSYLLATKFPDAKVLTIDFDSQGNIAHALGLDIGKKNLARLLKEDDPDMYWERTKENLVTVGDDENGRPKNWLLLPSDASLGKAQMMVYSMSNLNGLTSGQTNSTTSAVQGMLQDRLATLIEMVDFVIIDCPPTHTVFMQSVYQMAQSVILPVKVDYLATMGAKLNAAAVRESQSLGIEIGIDLVVPTFFSSNCTVDKMIVGVLTEAYTSNRVTAPIPQLQVFSNATSRQMLVTEFAPKSKASLAYEDVVEKLLMVAGYAQPA